MSAELLRELAEAEYWLAHLHYEKARQALNQATRDYWLEAANKQQALADRTRDLAILARAAK